MLSDSRVHTLKAIEAGVSLHLLWPCSTELVPYVNKVQYANSPQLETLKAVVFTPNSPLNL